MSENKQDKQEKVTVAVDPTFHMKVTPKVSEEELDPAYKEYRRRWNENPKNFVLDKFPIHIDLESASGCNLKCKMCFQSFNPPPSGFMDMELFKKIINEGTAKGLCSIKLQYRGEPLLHPKLPEMVKYAKEKGVIEVMFNTNGTLLDEEKAKAFIDANLDKIIFSIDGHTPEVYEKIRIGGKFKTVLENVKRLKELRDATGKRKPYIRVQMVDMPENHQYVKDYIKFWSQYADYVAIEDLNDYHKTPIKNPPKSDFCCAQLWQRMMVRYDGQVTACCGDIYGEYPIGDANKSTIEELWLGPKMTAIREQHKKGRSDIYNMCVTCGLRQNYIKAQKNREGKKS